MSGKQDVFRWTNVATYVATFPTVDDEGEAEVEVQIGEADGLWYVRTTDDAGGSDDADDTGYPSAADATAPAEAFARERDESQ